MIHKISIKIWDSELSFNVDTDREPLLEENLRRAADIINDRLRTMMLDYDVRIQDALSMLLLSQVKENLLLRSNDDTESGKLNDELAELERNLEEYLSRR